MIFKRAAVLWVSAACCAGLGGCSAPKPPPFYQARALAAAPGTIINAEPFSPSLQGAAAYRVIYNSTDINGQNIAVSAIIYVPLAPPPTGGRNIVAWAHPTTGMAPGCAPSLQTGGLGGITMADSIPGLANFIGAGDIVTATDYAGMGVQGVHPYLVGESEGRAILDSVRAAKAMPGADVSGKYVVWGHSQGGQAALFAGQIAQSYAPELSLAGIAAAAPPSDLNHELTEPFSGNSGRLFAAYVYYSWSHTYNVPVTTVVDPRAIPAMRNAAGKCIDSLGEAIGALHAAGALNPVFLTHPPASTPPWPALFYKNSPGHAPPGAALLIVQGSKDTTVEPHYTRTYVALSCAKHEVVDYQELKGVSHLLVAYKSVPIVTAWIAGRFAGTKPLDNCAHAKA